MLISLSSKLLISWGIAYERESSRSATHHARLRNWVSAATEEQRTGHSCRNWRGASLSTFSHTALADSPGLALYSPVLSACLAE
ncbi:unnamed protein product, partial [Iphiclides podalirius]